MTLCQMRTGTRMIFAETNYSNYFMTWASPLFPREFSQSALACNFEAQGEGRRPQMGVVCGATEIKEINPPGSSDGEHDQDAGGSKESRA